MRALRLLFWARCDEALGVVMIDASAQVIVASGDLVALGECLVASFLDQVTDGAPLFFPGFAAIGFRRARAQPLASTVDLLERDHAIGRHPLQDQSRIRPEKIIAEMIDPRSAVHRTLLCAVVD